MDKWVRFLIASFLSHCAKGLRPVAGECALEVNPLAGNPTLSYHEVGFKLVPRCGCVGNAFSGHKLLGFTFISTTNTRAG